MLGLFNWFKKEEASTPINCKTCKYYGFVKSDDKLNPDKTVTKGQLQYEFCTKGAFYLNDYNACEFHKTGIPSARIMPPPIGLNNGK